MFSGFDSVPFPREYELARARIRHIHVKDPGGTDGYVRVGDGLVPWSAIVRRLAADDYPGYLSFETHWRHDRVLNQAERDQPWGAAFSDGGCEATRECVRALRAIAGDVAW